MISALFLVLLALPVSHWQAEDVPLRGCVSDDHSRYALVQRESVAVLGLSDSKLELVETIKCDYPTCCTFLAGSSDLAIDDGKGVTLIRNVKGEVTRTRLEIPYLCPRVLLSPTGNSLVALTPAGNIWRIDLKKGEAERVGNLGKDRVVREAALSGDKKHIAIGMKSGEVLILACHDFSECLRIEAHLGSIHAVTFTDRDQVLVTAGRDGTVKAWSLSRDNKEWTAKCATTIETASPVLALCAERKNVLVGLESGRIEWYSRETGKPLMSPSRAKADPRLLNCLVFPTKTNSMIVAVRDKSVALLRSWSE